MGRISDQNANSTKGILYGSGMLRINAPVQIICTEHVNMFDLLRISIKPIQWLLSGNVCPMWHTTWIPMNPWVGHHFCYSTGILIIPMLLQTCLKNILKARVKCINGVSCCCTIHIDYGSSFVTLIAHTCELGKYVDWGIIFIRSKLTEDSQNHLLPDIFTQIWISLMIGGALNKPIWMVIQDRSWYISSREVPIFLGCTTLRKPPTYSLTQWVWAILFHTGLTSWTTHHQGWATHSAATQHWIHPQRT